MTKKYKNVYDIVVRLVFLGVAAAILGLAFWVPSVHKGAAVPAAGPMAGQTTVWIAADPHYLSPALTDQGPYFQRMLENADGRVTMYMDELMEALVEEAIAQKPDALILPGDVTFNGERQSHIDLAAKLQRVSDAGVPVLILPGNHDLENANASCYQGNERQRVNSVTAAEFEEIYGGLYRGTVLERDPVSLSYTAELAHDLRVLLVDVNTVDSPGALTDATFTWVEQQLEDAKRCGARVIAASHQNLLAHNSLFAFGCVMGGAGVLRELYEEYGVLCNLSGHMHIQHIARSEGGCLDIAASALTVSPNQYGVLTLGESGVNYRTQAVDVSGWAAKQGTTNGDLQDFEQFSHDFFEQMLIRQADKSLGDSDDASQLASFYAQVNIAYFAGRMDALDWDDGLYDQWQEHASFTRHYLESIAEDGFRDHTTFSFSY